MRTLAALMLTACLLCAGLPADDAVKDRQAQLRQQLSNMLGIPRQRVPLAPESRGEVEHDGVVIEKWIFTSEPGSRVPAVLYRPKNPPGPMPAIVFTYGHGGSKSSWSYNYAALLYAKLGVATLAMDPIGEEERNLKGATATRAHDAKGVSERCDAAGRLIMGKFIFDTMRAVDFLMTRKDIAHDRIGIAGNSLGGATGGWVAALETRLRMAIVTGWAYDDVTIPTKLCTRLPNERMRKLCSWSDYASLPAPHCALLIANGDADVVIDHGGTGVAWSGTRAVVAEARKHYPPGGIEAWFEPGGGHRPYFAYPVALEWIHKHLGTPGWTLEKIRALPTLNAGEWCDRHGIKLEKLYGTPLHWRGAILPVLGLRPTPRVELACLRPDEIGRPEFTLEGWLEQISKQP
jgi:dienelactone hydrolase